MLVCWETSRSTSNPAAGGIRWTATRTPIAWSTTAWEPTARRNWASRGEDADVHELPKPKKKTAAKKTTAKKTAGKRQPAKKTAAAKKTTGHGRRPRSGCPLASPGHRARRPAIIVGSRA
ncbi:hypothetical protein ACGFZJ_11800 [Streptomyces sp. NPDC048253]|uniref:hypothetical protein n=1 Tax=Streptomyces sp. NPDC048253 TaxID=3365524 RepID=UPI0037156EDC